MNHLFCVLISPRSELSRVPASVKIFFAVIILATAIFYVWLLRFLRRQLQHRLLLRLRLEWRWPWGRRHRSRGRRDVYINRR